MDNKLIPMEEITDEARELAVIWGENMKDDFIAQKHKLASDIMNYARRYHEQLDKKSQSGKRIVITEKEFAALVQGGEVEIDGVKMILSDFGFYRMRGMVMNAQI